MRVRHTRGETGPPAQSRARATYYSSVSVELLLSASESAAAPASPIFLNCRLQRWEEGQVCSWRDMAAGAKQGARDLLQLSQQAQCIRKLVTVPPAFELLKHNCLCVHLCVAPHASPYVCLLKSRR
jgi:hypothetical protein